MVAPSIVEAYREAIAPNNPGYADGISENGPVAKFVFYVIPYMTGERPKSISSVGTQLKAKFRELRATREIPEM